MQGMGGMRSILVAINRFPAAETTVSVAAGLASALVAPLCILHVRPAPAARFAAAIAPDEAVPDRRQELLAELVDWSAMLSDLETTGAGVPVDADPQADLRRAVDLAQRGGVATVSTCLEAGDPAEVILARTRQMKADLLVIGRGRAPHALGQTAAAVISRCRCAVVVAGGSAVMH